MESLSLKIEYYQTLLNHIIILKKKLKNDLDLNLNLEVATNLINGKFIKQEWINLFKKFNDNNLVISTSYECDTYRFTFTNYEKWLNNIKVLKENNIKLDLNFILTKGNVNLLLSNNNDLLNLFKYFESIYMYYFISYGKGNTNEKFLIPNYNDIISLLNNIKNNKYEFNINGLFEDNLLVFEEDELFNINLTPSGLINFNLDVFDINFNNKINDETSKIIENLNKYINWNVKNKFKYLLKNCVGCNYINECLGGIEEYSNITFNNFNDCQRF